MESTTDHTVQIDARPAPMAIDPRQTVALNYANPGLIDPHELDGSMSAANSGDKAPVEIDQANAEATASTLRQVFEQSGVTEAQVHVENDERGVVIVRVKPGSTAEEMGVREGDIVLEVNRKPINSIKSYERAVSGLAKDQAVLLLLKRKGQTIYLTLRP